LAIARRDIVRRLILAALLTVASAAPLAAGYDEGLRAYQRGDYATALQEFLPLAEQGHAFAQNNLATMYAQGLGASQNYAEAARWFRRAAEQGERYAQNNLGYLYAEGLGLARDDVLAYMWFSLAGETENRDLVAERMSAAQIAEAEQLARDWRPKKE
jgi:hypothetical protein